MPVALQVTSAVRHSPTANGWPSYLIEDHVNFAQTFQSQLLSMISEGVFTRFPKLKVVLLGAGIGWVPSFLWRGTKEWRALRREVPWVDRSPAQILRDHVRISCQPLDAPPDPNDLATLLEMIGCDDMLLFATDWPHWRFDGTEALAPGLPDDMRARLLRDNALATYPRLKGSLS
jgi:predicted TIM-barrel fold metal-dependent hydrolase